MWQGTSSKNPAHQVLHISRPLKVKTRLTPDQRTALEESGMNPDSPDIMKAVQDAYSLPLGGIRMYNNHVHFHYTAALPTDDESFQKITDLCEKQANFLENDVVAENLDAPSAGSDSPAKAGSETAWLYETFISDYGATSTNGVDYTFTVVWRADSDAQSITANYAPVKGIGDILYLSAPIATSPTERTTRVLASECGKLLEGDVVMDNGKLLLRYCVPVDGLTKASLGEKLRVLAGAATALRTEYGSSEDKNLLTFG